MSSVNWDTPTKINGRTRFACTCPCGRVRWLVKKDARYVEQHESPCFTCSQTIKARLGFQANVAKYGRKFALKRVQTFRLENPTPSEQMVSAILDQMGLEYVREYRLDTKAKPSRRKTYFVDHMVVSNGSMWAIEVNGGCHINHIARDKRKMSLLKRRHIPALVLTADQVESGDCLIAIQEFLNIRQVVLA